MRFEWKWILIAAAVLLVLYLGWKRYRDSQAPATETATSTEG